MTARRRGRRIAALLLILVIALVIVIALAPMLASLPFARTIAANAVSDQINGEAAIDDMSLSWFGAQEVTGLSITDESGREALRADVTLDASLFSLITGSVDALNATLLATVNAELREDGSTSLHDLLPPADPDDDEQDEDDADRAPLRLEGLPALHLTIEKLDADLTILDRPGGRTLLIRDAEGEAHYTPGGDATVDFTANTSSDDLDGRIALNLIAKNLFDATGLMTPAGASIDAHISGDTLPLPYAEQVRQLKSFLITGRSTNLAEQLDLNARLDVMLDADQTSTLEGELALTEPIRPDGSVQLRFDELVGELRGRNVPASIIQPFLASTPVLITRDLGPIVNVDLGYYPGTDEQINLSLTAEHLSLDGRATVNEDGSLDARNINASLTVHPDLLAEIAPVTLDAPARVIVAFEHVHVPPLDDKGAFSPAHLALDGTLAIPDPLRARIEGESPMDLDAADIELDLRTERLSEGVHCRGAATVAEGRITFDEHIANLVDDDGAFTFDQAAPVGALTVTDLPADFLRSLLAPIEQDDLVAAAINGPVSLTVNTQQSFDTLIADADFTAGDTTAQCTLERADDAFALTAAEAQLTLTPALAEALQKDAESPVVLVQNAPVRIALAPWGKNDATARYPLPPERIRAQVTIDELALDHDQLKDQVALRSLSALVGVTLADAGPSLAVAADGQIRRFYADKRIVTFRCDLTADPEGEGYLPKGTFNARSVAIRQVEKVLGLDRDAIAAWTGATGDIDITLDATDGVRGARLQWAMPNVSGAMSALMRDDMLILGAEDLACTLKQDAVNDWLAPPAPDGADDADVEPITIAADVPVTLAIDDFRLPFAALKGEAFDPAAVAVNLRMQGGPLALAQADAVFSTIDALSASITCSDLDDGVVITMNGAAARTEEETEPGELAVNATLTNFTDDLKRLNTDAVAMDLDATVRRMPTAMADTLLSAGGLLTAAVGQEMNAHFTGRQFSRTGGALDARIETPNGFVEGRLEGEEGDFRTTTDAPVHGELEITQPLRDHLLQRIHPILADVRTTEQPMRLNMPTRARLPLDGDFSRLHGDLEITIGAVEFDGGSASLKILQLFSVTKERVPGSIEPIIARIREGVITYDRFAVNIGEYAMLYEGSVDLNTMTADLKTSLPLKGLAHTFGELEGYVENITVPMVMRGPVDTLKLEIDPDFDLGKAVIEAGFRGVLDGASKAANQATTTPSAASSTTCSKKARRKSPMTATATQRNPALTSPSTDAHHAGSP